MSASLSHLAARQRSELDERDVDDGKASCRRIAVLGDRRFDWFQSPLKQGSDIGDDLRVAPLWRLEVSASHDASEWLRQRGLAVEAELQVIGEGSLSWRDGP